MQSKPARTKPDPRTHSAASQDKKRRGDHKDSGAQRDLTLELKSNPSGEFSRKR